MSKHTQLHVYLGRVDPATNQWHNSKLRWNRAEGCSGGVFGSSRMLRQSKRDYKYTDPTKLRRGCRCCPWWSTRQLPSGCKRRMAVRRANCRWPTSLQVVACRSCPLALHVSVIYIVLLLSHRFNREVFSIPRTVSHDSHIYTRPTSTKEKTPPFKRTHFIYLSPSFNHTHYRLVWRDYVNL